MSDLYAIMMSLSKGVLVMENQSIYANYKSGRLLVLYTKLLRGESINKSEEACRFGVDEKSIQRDIADLRAFFENQVLEGESCLELVYDRKQNAYLLQNIDQATLTNDEILAVCKILLESRALCKSEMESIIKKLIASCVPQKNKECVSNLIRNELFHYIEPHHQKQFIKELWKIGTAIKECRMLHIQYEKQDGSVVERNIKPVGIMVSEYYFYLTAFIDDKEKAETFREPNDKYPTIYRIDRILTYDVLSERFEVPYKDRFEEGEFRKRVQFMYGGRLRKIRFKYTGPNVEAVLDRLPTALIEKKTADGFILNAEVFGDGIDMWIRSQGDYVTIL